MTEKQCATCKDKNEQCATMSLYPDCWRPEKKKLKDAGSRILKWEKMSDQERKDIFKNIVNDTTAPEFKGGFIDPDRERKSQINSLSSQIKELQERIERIEDFLVLD